MSFLGKSVYNFLVFCIKVYQFTISPLMGPSKCRYTPTCSDYALQSLKKYGVLKGLWLSVKRIARCAPWGSSGFDPVP